MGAGRALPWGTAHLAWGRGTRVLLLLATTICVGVGNRGGGGAVEVRNLRAVARAEKLEARGITGRPGG